MSDNTFGITAKLRSRLTTIPKPGVKPFKPMYPIVSTVMIGGDHQPGDDAGWSSINPNIGGAAGITTDFTAFLLQPMVYAIEPLCEEAATAIEQLRGALKLAAEMLEAWHQDLPQCDENSPPTVYSFCRACGELEFRQHKVGCDYMAAVKVFKDALAC